MKILITGASGFIGTNLLDFFLTHGYEALNLDIKEPKNKAHISLWQKVDLCDYSALEKAFTSFNPDYVVHLAARTDLNEVDGMDHYKANTLGVENIVKLCSKIESIKRVIFASSMLVNTVGYNPRDIFDYNPATTYGKSKVVTEKIILDNANLLPEFCIIRPTSIWGEWFGEPYKNFFDYVLGGRFFHMGDKACTKTYGYVGNATYQIKQLLHADKEKIQRQIFYIGDRPPVNISEWADEIAVEAHMPKPKHIPFAVFSLAACLGDIAGKIGVKFPMTSFRLNNMTTNHIVDLDNTYSVCGEPPFSRIEGIKRTLSWIKNN